MVVMRFLQHYLIAYQNLMTFKIHPDAGSSTGRHIAGDQRARPRASPCDIDGVSAVVRATSMAYLLSLRRLGGAPGGGWAALGDDPMPPGSVRDGDQAQVSIAVLAVVL
jgi:hypothetical protein